MEKGINKFVQIVFSPKLANKFLYIARINLFMHGIILAAGEGTRMRPLTRYMPKVMIPVGNKPIIEYVIESFRKNGIYDIVIVVGYMADKIKQYFGNGKDFGVKIEYRMQNKQLGTAHALYQAKDVDDDFILVYGDNLVPPECVSELMRGAANTILASMAKKPYTYGAIDTAHGVKIVRRKGVEGLVFTGVGHFNQDIFSKIEEGLSEDIYDLPDLLNRFSNLRYISSDCGWEDSLYPWDLLKMNSHVLSKNPKVYAGKIERANIIGNVEIGEGSFIGGGAYIKGNVKIGKNVTIGPGTVIIGDTSIGNGVEIGALSYIENSIIMCDTSIGEGSYIKDSVLGRNCTIQPKFMAISGRKRIITNGDIIEMEGGAVMGDNAVIGAGVVVHPCIRIGANARISDLKVIHEDIEDDVSVM